ncbi:MAG TPA: hypothetical protein VNK04_17735 [Gemmataceae bacterium]|nr:hypothetical protein [Gemmataceae bacterium]
MAEETEDIARLLGGKVIGEVPDVGGGAFGAARLARFYRARMEEIRRQQSAPARGERSVRLELDVNGTTAQALTELAQLAGRGGQETSPEQLAAGLLESVSTQLLEEIKQTAPRLGTAQAEGKLAEATWRKVIQAILAGAASDHQATD